MSLFSRVLSRAGLPGGAPLARMKGQGPIAREEASEEDEAKVAPLRRTPSVSSLAARVEVPEAEDPEARPLDLTVVALLSAAHLQTPVAWAQANWPTKPLRWLRAVRRPWTMWSARWKPSMAAPSASWTSPQ